jgi:hypothetical protein
MDRMDDKLDALWVEYREACLDPEPSPEFMPRLWQKIEARRVETTSVFRRVAQICVMATLALTLFMSVVLIPRYQSEVTTTSYNGTYVDSLADQHADDFAEIIPVGDVR